MQQEGSRALALAVGLSCSFVSSTAIGQVVWQQLSLPPALPQIVSACWDSSRSLLFASGFDTSTLQAQLWRRGASGWQLTPAPPNTMQLVFDSFRNRVVGVSTSVSTTDPTIMWNDIWEWDGSVWSHPTNIWPGRDGFGLAFDTLRHRVVLFGGVHFDRVPSETLEWDGTSVIPRTVAPQPPSGQAGVLLAYDERRGVTVLFSGVSETWEWNGNAWLLRTPATSPPPRGNPAMAWDPVRARVVLFGGSGASGLLDDTWEWDGNDWSQRTPAVSPSPRFRSTFTYDGASEGLLLFGGANMNWFRDEWLLVAQHPATVLAFGSACSGTAGTPVLSIAGGQRPWLGDTVTLQVQPVPSGAPALLALGSSNTTWSGLPLPAPLATLGMPGCDLLVAFEQQLAMATAGNTASVAVSVPAQSALIGATFYLQAAVLDPPANPFGAVASGGLAVVLGAR